MPVSFTELPTHVKQYIRDASARNKAAFRASPQYQALSAAERALFDADGQLFSIFATADAPWERASLTPEQSVRMLDAALTPDDRAACEATGMNALEFFAARCGWGKETLEAKGARLGLSATDIEACRQTGCDPEMFAAAKAGGR